MAGAGYKTFTAGEVLTASDVNLYLAQQVVQNYAGTAARSSAIPSPSTGMVSYVGDDGNGVSQIQAYNGSAWKTMGGLVLIKTQTIGTAVSSVTVTNAFNATYEQYRIVVTGGSCSVADRHFRYILGASATGYDYALIAINFSSGGGNDNWGTSSTAFPYAGATGPNGHSSIVEITNPFLAKYTTFTSNLAADAIGGTCIGIHRVATSYTDFTLSTNSGTLTGGTIAVYGYRKA